MHIVDLCIAFDNFVLYVMLLAIILVEVFSIRSWTTDVESFLVQNEQSTLLLRTESAAGLASVSFADMASDMSLVKNFTQHIINGSIPIKDYPANYFNAPSYGPNVTSEVRAKNSGWYNHFTEDDPSNTTLNANLNTTSLFRHPWSIVSDTWLAQGFGDANGLTRFFPLSSNDAFPTIEYTCTSNDPEKNGQTVTGYDPRCRAWYAPAQSNPNEIIYSSPYEDALTGAWVITLSTAVIQTTTSSSTSSSSIYGILWADVSMTALQTFFQSLDGDHAFLIDTAGNLIAHNSFDIGTTLMARLYPFSTSDQASFQNSELVKMTSSDSGTLSYNYQGRVYVGAFAKVQGTNYITGIFVDKTFLEDKTERVKGEAESKIFIICYLISYFALYSLGVGSTCCGYRPTSAGDGVKRIGLPLAFLFVCLLAIALPISFVSNQGVINDTDELLTEQTRETVRQLSINNGDWLQNYLQSAWVRSIKPLFITTLSLDPQITSELESGVSYYDDTTDSSKLLGPLVEDPRLKEKASWQVSLGAPSVFVSNVTTSTQLAALNSTVQAEINSTQLMDQVFRSVYSTSPEFVVLYLGTDNRVFRKYPGYISSDSSYDPTTRGWWSGATSATHRSDSEAGYYKGSYYTAPYQDAFSREWMITVSRATPLAADKVVAGDLLISQITHIFSSIKFFRTGKATLLDLQTSTVVADRDLTLTSDRTAAFSFSQLSAPTIGADLFARMQQEDSVGPEIIEGAPGEGGFFYIFSKKLTDTNLNRYAIMTSVPVEEAREAVEPTLQRIRDASTNVALGLGLSSAVVVILILASSALCRGGSAALSGGDDYKNEEEKETDGAVSMGMGEPAETSANEEVSR